MDSIDLEEARDRLGELIDRVEAGESIDICRCGKAVARLTAAASPRKRIDPGMLAAVTASMPPQTQTAADLVRSLRDAP